MAKRKVPCGRPSDSRRQVRSAQSTTVTETAFYAAYFNSEYKLTAVKCLGIAAGGIAFHSPQA